MKADLAMVRRFYAEEVQAVSNVRTESLVEALARVQREDFLPPGPWLIRAEGDMAGPPRETPDADPRHVYHNVSIALDSRLREVFTRGAWPRFNRLRCDPHEPKPGCWLHADTFCFCTMS